MSFTSNKLENPDNEPKNLNVISNITQVVMNLSNKKESSNQKLLREEIDKIMEKNPLQRSGYSPFGGEIKFPSKTNPNITIYYGKNFGGSVYLKIYNEVSEATIAYTLNGDSIEKYVYLRVGYDWRSDESTKKVGMADLLETLSTSYNEMG